MQSIFLIGTILLAGFVAGELVRLVRLPKVTGYIVAGIFLNPQICKLIPQNFPEHTSIITNIALAFITFSVGGTLLYSHIKRLGKIVLSITFFEAEFAFLVVAVGFMFISPFFVNFAGATLLNFFIPLGLLMGVLASPTDPSATLAVVHEYKAKGEVTSTIMGVAAMDDILGIMNYSVAVVLASIFVSHSSVNMGSLFIKPVVIISGSIALGTSFGIVFNVLSKFIKRETEGVLIVLIFSLLCLCYGTATIIKVDELLATVAMGVTVVNFNKNHVKIFNMLERYTEELIFVLFFTISGMHLNFSVLMNNIVLVMLFVVLRTSGKFLGVMTGSNISNATVKIKKYAAGGLIPQGGIVIGLALLIKQNPVFEQFSDVLINVIIGATVLHELIGPVFAKLSIVKAGEIKGTNKAT